MNAKLLNNISNRLAVVPACVDRTRSSCDPRTIFRFIAKTCELILLCGALTLSANAAVPGAPTAAAPTSVTISTLTANWSLTSGASSYTLYFYTGPSWTLVRTYTGITGYGFGASYGVLGLTPGTTYGYCVSGVNASGTGPSGCYGTFSTSTAASAENVTVDATNYLVDVERQPLGVNLAWYYDSDANRPSGSATLQSALTSMGIRHLRFQDSDFNTWTSSHQPVLARFGVDDYPSNYSPITVQPPNATNFTQTSLSFDQEMSLCSAIGCVPSVVAPVRPYYTTTCPVQTSGPTQQDLINASAAWVAYAKSQGYKIPYWEIGNEPFNNGGGCNNPALPASVYAADVPLWSSAMKAADPTILAGAACNSNTNCMAILQNQPSSTDFLIIHNYPYNLNFSDYVGSSDLSSPIEAAEYAIQNSGLSSQDVARMKIAITEMDSMNFTNGAPWQDYNDLGHSMSNFELIFQNLSLHPKLSFEEVWETRWVGNENQTNPYSISDMLTHTNTLTPAGQILALASSSLHNKILASSYTNDLLVRPYATYDQYTGNMNIFLVNRDSATHTVNVNISHYTPQSSTVSTKVFSGTSYLDTAPTLANASAATISGGVMTVTVSPYSITQYMLTGQNTNGLNLLQNGSLENLGGANWSPTGSGSYSFTVPNSFDGNNAYSVTNGECLSQAITNQSGQANPINSSSTYNLSAQAFVNSGTAYVYAYAVPSYTQVAEVAVTAVGPAYTNSSKTGMTLPTGSNGIVIYLCGPSGSTATANFDDVVFTK